MRAFSREPERNNLAVLSTGSAAERPAAAEIGGRPHPVRDETNAQRDYGPSSGLCPCAALRRSASSLASVVASPCERRTKLSSSLRVTPSRAAVCPARDVLATPGLNW